MFQTLKNAWKIPELRKKMLFTILIIVLYRLGSNIFVPYVDASVMSAQDALTGSSIFSFLNLMSGNAFGNATLFALSVSPYITASIVMQLLTIAIPALERLSKQGEEGRKKISAMTRWVTVGLALVTAYGYTMLLAKTFPASYGLQVLTFEDGSKGATFKYIVMIACYCAGAALIMWLAERINEFGIGNGISIILFAGIISAIPNYVQTIIAIAKAEKYLAVGILYAVLIVIGFLAVTVLTVWFTNSERRIPVQYAKRVVGRKMYGGQSSNLPLKLNMAGVMPIIFASSIVNIPATIATFTNQSGKFATFVKNYLGSDTWLNVFVYIVLIIAFSYFYIMISFNPMEVANNIRNNGGAVPGIRPGKPTSDYITKILNRITMLGALFLIVVSGVPMIINVIAEGGFATFAHIGSSLLIVVGVALETVHDLEAQMTMRNYKGFLD